MAQGMHALGGAHPGQVERAVSVGGMRKKAMLPPDVLTCAWAIFDIKARNSVITKKVLSKTRTWQ